MKTLLTLAAASLLWGGFKLYKYQSKSQTSQADWLEVGRLLYPNHTNDFASFFNQYLTDKAAFEEEQQDLIEEYSFEKLDPLRVTYLFGDSRGLLGYIDWRGEENEGEVEEYVQKQLSGPSLAWPTTQAYRQKHATASQNDGKFIIGLFQEIDKDLKKEGKQLLFFDLSFDAYVFRVVDAGTFKEIQEKAPANFHGTEKLKK